MSQGWNLRLRDRGGLSSRARFERTRRRVQLVIVVCLGWLAFCVIGAAFFVQQKDTVVEHTDYVDVRTKRGPRGPVLDRNGVVMAEDLVTEALTVDPRWVRKTRPRIGCMELDPKILKETNAIEEKFKRTLSKKIAKVLAADKPDHPLSKRDLKQAAAEVYGVLTKQSRDINLLAGLDKSEQRALRQMIVRERLHFLSLRERALVFDPSSYPKFAKPSLAKAKGLSVAKAIAGSLGLSANDLGYQVGFALRKRKKRTLVSSLSREQTVAIKRAVRGKSLKGFGFTYALKVDPVKAAARALDELPHCSTDEQCRVQPGFVCRVLPQVTGGARCVPACHRKEQDRSGEQLAGSKKQLTLAARSRWATLIQHTLEQVHRSRRGFHGNMVREFAALLYKADPKVAKELWKSKTFAARRRQARRLRRIMGYETSHVYLARDLPLWKADAFKRMLAAKQLPGLSLERSTRRHNPNGATAGVLLGRQSWPGALERMVNHLLRGRKYKEITLRTVGGRRMPWYGSSNPNDFAGHSVKLTIDSVVQEVTEHHLVRGVKEGKAKFGVAVVMDAKTGEVVAMAQSGLVDPNGRLLSASATKNKVTQDGAEPGSTFKSLLLAIALELGVVTPTTQFDASKPIAVPGKLIRDSHRHGVLTACDCLKVSSNICFGKIAMRIGKERLYNNLKKFGIGEITNLGLPGEIPGRLDHWSKWSFAQFINIAFGQGVATTSIQLARAYTAIANGGVLLRPRLIREVRQADGELIEPYTFAVEPGQRVVSERVAKQVMSCMARVPQKGGTARRARLPEYTVAGKTGTAQQAENGRYSPTHWVASFAMVTPVEKPRFVIYVAVDTPDLRHPKYPNLVLRTGGRIAAPIAREIARFLLPYRGVPTSPGAPWLTHDEPAVAKQRFAARQARKAARSRPAAPAPKPVVTVKRLPAPPKGRVRVPRLHGVPMVKAIHQLLAHDLKPKVHGSGVVLQQIPSAGAIVKPGAVVRLVLSPPSALAQVAGGADDPR